MASRNLTVLCVHGLGDHRTSDWAEQWSKAVTAAFPGGEAATLTFEFLTYDDIFETVKNSPIDYAVALFKLAKSGLSSIGRRRRGILSDVSNRVRWTAGYVVAWVEDEKFQTATRARVFERLRQTKPDIILAHSLGSLITYNAFAHAQARDDAELAAILGKAHYVTFGSQIGNPFVIGNLTNGRIQTLPVRFWHHLYNEHDDVFTAEIPLFEMENFLQTLTPFDDDGLGDHSAVRYIGHAATIENVWRPMAANILERPRSLSLPAIRAPEPAKSPARKRQKALLVGINDYHQAVPRLEGCVNDVFTMSAVLQQGGIPADAIRVCLDERATTEGILTRFKWLLDDPRPGDELIFYFSGHGARVPEYGENFEPDHHIEALVPFDFDWSPERYISDDQIFNLYSQLPYDCRLVMIFDCCHAGDIHKGGQGGSASTRPRGVSPPDDIRHRALKWDVETEMWVSRDFERINAKFTREKEVATDFFGRDGATQRLGRAGALRQMSYSQYERLKKTDERLARGPYLPVIIEACGELEFAHEYQHGATSHGAFTYSLASILRRQQKLTFRELVAKTEARLADLGYQQKPNILGPNFILDHPIPWRT